MLTDVHNYQCAPTIAAGSSLSSLEPPENVLYRGELGLAQVSAGIDSHVKIMAQSIAAKHAEDQPIHTETLRNLLKETTGEPLTKKHLVSFRLAYLDHCLSRYTRLFPTELGLILPTKLPEPTESLARIFRDFSLPDRLRLVREISIEGEITKTALKKRVYFPGSLDYNLSELKSRHAITIHNETIAPGNDFRKYCDALDCLLSAVKQAREERSTGKVRVLLVSHLMTEKALWKTIDPNENLSQAVDQMLEESVQGLVIRLDASIKILNRLRAFQAYQNGVPGSTSIADLATGSVSGTYLIDPIDPVEPTESVASLAMKMYDKGVSYALIRKNGSPEGIVALSDILNLYRDQESPTK
jgi:hypothetical protein